MPVQVAIIGATGHIQYVIEGIREIPGARICALAPGGPEESIEAIRLRVQPAPDAAVYGDYRKLLDREKPDVVVVTPRFHRHAEAACAALERGIAVYSEKPLALTLESLETVRAIQQKSKAPIGIMLNFRYAPTFSTARTLVADGRIGRPAAAYAQKSYKRGNRPDYYKKRAEFGGIIPWVGIHAIDWLRWVGGWELTAVYGCHTKLFRPDYPEMEDAATCLFETDNGGSAVMSFDFLRPPGAPTHGDDRLRIAGEKGVIEVRDAEERLEYIDAAGVHGVRLEEPKLGPFADFVTSLLNPGHTCRISTEDALRVTEIALKARDAADQKKRVEL